MTDLRLTRFEEARLLGTRAEQLATQAKPLVDTTGLTDPLEIARKEYIEGVIPISVIRTLPNGKKFRIDIKPKTRSVVEEKKIPVETVKTPPVNTKMKNRSKS